MLTLRPFCHAPLPPWPGLLAAPSGGVHRGMPSHAHWGAASSLTAPFSTHSSDMADIDFYGRDEPIDSGRSSDRSSDRAGGSKGGHRNPRRHPRCHLRRPQRGLPPHGPALLAPATRSSPCTASASSPTSWTPRRALDGRDQVAPRRRNGRSRSPSLLRARLSLTAWALPPSLPLRQRS